MCCNRLKDMSVIFEKKHKKSKLAHDHKMLTFNYLVDITNLLLVYYDVQNMFNNNNKNNNLFQALISQE